MLQAWIMSYDRSIQIGDLDGHFYCSDVICDINLQEQFVLSLVLLGALPAKMLGAKNARGGTADGATNARVSRARLW